MSSAPKILLIAPQPFFSNRGTPLNVRAIAECLTGQGYEVDLLTYPLGEDISVSGLNIIRSSHVPGIKSVPVGISASKVILDFFLFAKALKLVCTTKYDVMHGIEEAAVFTGFLSMFNGKVSVFDMDSSIPDQLRESSKPIWKIIALPVSILEQIAMRRSKVVLTVCEALSNKAASVVDKKKIVQIEDFPTDVDNTPPDDFLTQIKKEFDLGDKPLVVYTGNFHSSQGIELLLESVAIAKDRLDFKLLLVGGGEKGQPDFDTIRNLVTRLNLENGVVLTGNRPLEEMSSFLSLARVLVSPRIKGENTPLKIYSYMNAERPIVATNIYSHTQVLNSQNAFLAAPDANAFAKQLEVALRGGEQAQRKAANAKSLVDERYSRSSFNTRLIEMYEGLLAA